jgi:hypothetical protein
VEGLDTNWYKPTGEVAAVATEKSSTLRGAVVRKASLTSATDDTTTEGFAFTNYTLYLPGEDRIIGTEDDWVGRDGMIMKVSSVSKGGIGRSVSAGALQP